MVISLSMENSLKCLSEADIRITPQRLAVYKVLSKGGHLRADYIYKEVGRLFPSISFATVYTILQLFKNKELALESRIDFERSTFEIRTDSHHHFMCRECDKIIDIDIPFCSALTKMKVSGLTIEDFHGYFYGLCKECKKKKKDA
ncbi:MAG: Fur family transcriptional regulator [Candidatus Kaelpia aquatica]|nr:Fur family transcriptional regulator [Candidatus Kaelpia aquatica]